MKNTTKTTVRTKTTKLVNQIVYVDRRSQIVSYSKLDEPTAEEKIEIWRERPDYAKRALLIYSDGRSKFIKNPNYCVAAAAA
jgi:hypothetical protein